MENNTTTYKKTNVQVEQDWDNDGFLRIKGAETLTRYSEIREQQYNLPVKEWGIFFAFSNEQFEEGYKDLVKRCLIKDGDKVKRFGNGAFGLSEGMRRWVQEADALDARIVEECDPYEVYLYEYNNYECCIDWDGDQRAVEAVLRTFGLVRTEQALMGRRFRPHGEIFAIYDDMRKN